MDDYSAPHLNDEHPDDELGQLSGVIDERGPVVVNVYDGGTVHVHRGSDYWTDTDEREPDAGGIDLHDGTWQHCGYYDLSDAGSAAEFVNQLRGPGFHVTKLHAFLTDVYRRRG